MIVSVFNSQIRVYGKCRLSLEGMEFLMLLGDFSYLRGCHLGNNVRAADEVTLFEGILASGR